MAIHLTGFTIIYTGTFFMQFQCFVRKPSRIWLNQFLWDNDKDPEIQDYRHIAGFQAVTSVAKGGTSICKNII
jgi:hypothetical protein